MNEVFDYKKMVREWRTQLWQRIASYTLNHPQEPLRCVARKFNVNKTTLILAMQSNGLRRPRGRKSFHYPPKGPSE